jgi:hypothetical protein
MRYVPTGLRAHPPPGPPPLHLYRKCSAGDDAQHVRSKLHVVMRGQHIHSSAWLVSPVAFRSLSSRSPRLPRPISASSGAMPSQKCLTNCVASWAKKRSEASSSPRLSPKLSKVPRVKPRDCTLHHHLRACCFPRRCSILGGSTNIDSLITNASDADSDHGKVPQSHAIDLGAPNADDALHC